MSTHASVTQPSTMFLRRMLGIGAILLAIGVVGARSVGRRATRPLQSFDPAGS